MRLSSHDRVLVLAPHPDDETLGAGALLQRAVAAGAAVRVVFVTDGDDNPWPQRVLERRLRIDGAARARWGRRRRSEACAALDALGVPRRCAVFLGYPDRGLLPFLVARPGGVLEALSAEIAAWRPTIVVMPSPRDRHPDHNTIAVVTSAALAVLAPVAPPLVLTYLVHPLQARGIHDVRLPLSDDERRRKLQAIERHETQLVFHRQAYRRAASACETLTGDEGASLGPRSIGTAVLDGGLLRVSLAGHKMPWPLLVTVLGWEASLRGFVLHASVSPLRRTFPVRDASGAVVAIGVRARTAGRAMLEFLLPCGTVSCFFVKVEKRTAFFDREGWVRGEMRATHAAARAEVHVTSPAGRAVPAFTA